MTTYPAKNYKVWYFTGGWANFTAHYLYSFFTMENALIEVQSVKAMGYPAGLQFKSDPDMKNFSDFETVEERKEYYYAHTS